jgi:hypothetical protein
MDKYQYMVIIVGAIFCVLLLLIFSLFVNMNAKERPNAKKIAPCPDYWEEVKDVRVVDVNPNTDFIYKDNTSFVKYQRKDGKYKTDPANNVGLDFTKDDTIGNNAVQGIRIMIDKNTPLLRINNEVTKKITACKVPSSSEINVGNIYKSGNLQLRNYSYGSKYNNLRNNYTTIDNIGKNGTRVSVKYDTHGKFYKLETPASYTITGDSLLSPIPTPGLYWKADCMDGTNCLSGKDHGNVKIWGNSYSDGGQYIPSEFYIDFKDNDWHAYNMQKSTKCNLKRWANANNIVWDGITNMDC